MSNEKQHPHIKGVFYYLLCFVVHRCMYDKHLIKCYNTRMNSTIMTHTPNIIKEKVAEFVKLNKDFDFQALVVPKETINWLRTALTEAKEQGRVGALESMKEEVKKEMNKNSCLPKHREPRTADGNEYDCSDIHIGREEMGSDLLSTLNEALKGNK